MPDLERRVDLGGRLKRRREEQGISLRQIADRTKISVTTLEALERNDLRRLPGGIFSRAVVRAYAGEVGADPESSVRDFLARFPDDSVAIGWADARMVDGVDHATSGVKRPGLAVMFTVPLVIIVLLLLSLLLIPV